MRELLIKIFEALAAREEAKREYHLGGGRFPITYRTFASAAGNHVFDDSPAKFGLVGNEGDQARAFTQRARAEDQAVLTLFSEALTATAAGGLGEDVERHLIQVELERQERMEEARCPACGVLNDLGDQRCGSCGGEIPSPKTRLP